MTAFKKAMTPGIRGSEGYPEFSGKVMVITSLEGSGTEEDPYLIQDGEDLVEMARMIDISADCAAAYYRMSADIEMKDIAFAGHGIREPLQRHVRWRRACHL